MPKLIRDITAKELIKMDLEDMVLEPMVVELLEECGQYPGSPDHQLPQAGKYRKSDQREKYRYNYPGRIICIFFIAGAAAKV